MKDNEQPYGQQHLQELPSDVQTPEEERLRYECEQALLRLRFKEPSGEEAWREFQTREGLRVARRSTHLWRWLGGVASVAAAVTAIVFWVTASRGGGAEVPMTQLSASVPEQTVCIEEEDGTDKATNVYRPSAAAKEVDKQGVIVSARKADYQRTRVKEVRHNIVSIPRGQMYQVLLNDGSEVWLNADSRLSFPSRFSGDKREVVLKGEAYFKVAHNPDKPFVVVTERMRTQVLGTEFNVKAYDDAENHVTLVRGSVKVHLSDSGGEVTLTPGQDISYSAEGSYQVKQVDTTYYLQWMDGYFYFDNVRLADILRELGHWYNIDIEMEDDLALMDLRLHFVAERSESVTQVIEILNLYEYLSANLDNGCLSVRHRR